MTLLTLFPPTFAVDERIGTANGTNSAFGARYWRHHPRAAAIAAHEVREARMSALALLASLIVTTGLFYLFNPIPGTLWTRLAAGVLIGFLPYAAYTHLKSRRRDTNITGEATEAVVEAERYGMTLEAALAEGAHQLANSRSYADCFDPEDEPDILERLTTKLPAARRWVKRNRGLIDKAMRLQAAKAAA